MNYPQTRKSDVVDEYFGVKIPDPYRWLEDDNSLETVDWVKSQNQVTFDYLNNLNNREKIKYRLLELSNFSKFSTPKKIGDKIYQWRNSGLQNQSVLYSRNEDDVQETSSKVVLDPNQLSKDGSIAIMQTAFSKNGRFLAYATSYKGSDWLTVSVLDLETGKTLEDKVEWLKRSNLSWFKDGFFYSRFPEPPKDDLLKVLDENHALYYHKLGTRQNEDVLVYHDPLEPKRDIRAEIASDESYLMLRTSLTETGWAVDLAYLNEENLDIKNLTFKSMISSEDYMFELIDRVDNELYFLTNYKAPNYRVIAVDFNNINEENWREIIPESEDNLYTYDLSTVKISESNKLVCVYLQDVHHIIKIFDLNGKLLEEVYMPGIGTVSGINVTENNFYFKFGSFINPGSVFRYEFDSKKFVLVEASETSFDSDSFETRQIFYTSKDGTKIPMFITCRKNLELNGQNPCWLYGYGGFTISVLPHFNPSKLAFLEMGGIYCVANIRGGGEYGQKWYESATKLNKKISHEDFIAAAEYLIQEKFTSNTKLIIEGVSNGGLLVGACLTSRPDLFGVCISRVGVHDMLRFQHFTEGCTWASDFGLSSDNKEMFEYLLSYSPLHTCKKASYPATLITTADHDDRVVPMHSFKFAATLQEAQVGNKPVLIRIDTASGHGAGKSISATIEEQADILAFALSSIS